MVELGLSAKQQKDDRLQQIKKEVIEMIKMRAPISKFKVGFGGHDEILQSALILFHD